jgi:hypothetical protein
VPASSGGRVNHVEQCRHETVTRFLGTAADRASAAPIGRGWDFGGNRLE